MGTAGHLAPVEGAPAGASRPLGLAAGHGPSNSRSSLNPCRPDRLKRLGALVRSGAIEPADAERLAGFLVLRGQGLADRTLRARRAALRRYGLADLGALEAIAEDARRRLDQGDDHDDVERDAGRRLLALAA